MKGDSRGEGLKGTGPTQMIKEDGGGLRGVALFRLLINVRTRRQETNWVLLKSGAERGCQKKRVFFVRTASGKSPQKGERGSVVYKGNKRVKSTFRHGVEDGGEKHPRLKTGALAGVNLTKNEKERGVKGFILFLKTLCVGRLKKQAC